ncbi:unnamed protein product [Rotaria magnacalcarata]|nr:unnamed protein product [Rotaria magnacalcarata]
MQFIFGYLEPDGLFMLRLLSSNTSDFVCTEVINQLWQRFYKKDTKRTKRNRKPESNSQQIAQERKHQIANTTETRDSIRCRSLKATSIPIQTNNGHDVLLRSRKSSFQPLVEDNIKSDMSSSEYIRKKNRLKKQWSYIDAALKIVQLTQQTEKRKYLREAIIKSDYQTFDKLLNDDPILVDCPAPVGYNHSNMYQIIVERSTDTFIDNVFKKYFTMIDNSTEGGKILVPIACERGDCKILQLILKHFPCAPLDGISNSNQSHNYLLHDEPRHLIQRELEAYENEIPLACIIRNDRSDLLSILFQFKSFSFDCLTQQQKQQIFYLCLLAEHRQVTIDKYNIKWYKNQSLRPCGSVECLRLLIEYAGFNPFHIFHDEKSFISPFTLIIEPIYLYLIQLHDKLLIDLQIKFHTRLLRALYDLINKQMQLFSYLISHCCLEPSESDIIRLNECNHYIDEIFHQSNEYLLVKRTMSTINNILSKIDRKNNDKCLSLKQICRFAIRDYVQNKQCVLVQVERAFVNLSSSHKKYLKCFS